MPGEDVVLRCERCDQELDRGDHLTYALDAPTLCDLCKVETQAEDESDRDLQERFLSDQYDRYVRALEELSWKVDQG